MSEYRGAYSGKGGDNAVPARGSFMQDDNQDTGKQKQPKQPDYSGGLSAPKPTKGNKYMGGMPKATDDPIFKG